MRRQILPDIKRVLIYGWLILLMVSVSSYAVDAQSKKKRASRMKSAAVLPKPSDAEMRELVEKTLLDFNDAVQRGDFSDFYSKICRWWQKQTSAKDLEKGFQEFINKKVDIGDIAESEAVFPKTPKIKKYLGYYTLILEGYYPTSPNRTKFALRFIPDNKEWKLSAIQIDTTPD